MHTELSIKNKNSKKHTQDFRKHFALNRNAAGFSSSTKELIYTLVCHKTEGPYVYDIDGHEYIDLTMGFGSILFGHNAKPIRASLEEQLATSWSVGPISPLAGQLAEKICQITNTERVAFFNSGKRLLWSLCELQKQPPIKIRLSFLKDPIMVLSMLYLPLKTIR